MPSFPSGRAVFTPYYNVWNRNVYTRRDPFVERPWQMDTGSTSGAAVVCGDNFLAGLTRPTEAEFRWDGRQLEIEAPPDAIFAQDGPPEAGWSAYHQRLRLPPAQPLFGWLPEYCTWVEQVCRTPKGTLPGETLGSSLIEELLESIDTQDWPRGRFTVDEGWAPRHGIGGYGSWEPRPGFDPERVAARIASHGHVPGLWLAPALICPASAAAREFPESVGAPVNMPGETPWNRFHYLRPGPGSAELIRRIFRRAWTWGFRKFKLDIFYGCRADMLLLTEQCRAAARALPGPVELEGHVPDPFFAQHLDVVRLNDVMISDRHPDWRSVVEGHYQVCRSSAPQSLLCLDHLGGNDPTITTADFLAHAQIMLGQLAHGYPVISLWPTRLGEAAVAATKELLQLSSARHRATPGDPTES